MREFKVKNEMLRYAERTTPCVRSRWVVAAVRWGECVGQVVVIQVLLPPHQLVDKQDIMAVVLKKEVSVSTPTRSEPT